VGRLVEIGVRRRLVALRVERAGLALPRLQLRPGEQRPSVRMVRDRQARAPTVGKDRRQLVDAVVKAAHETLDLLVGPHRERARHVGAVESRAQRRERCVCRKRDRDDRGAAGHEVRARRDHADRHRARRARLHDGGSQAENERSSEESFTHAGSFLGIGSGTGSSAGRGLPAARAFASPARGARIFSTDRRGTPMAAKRWEEQVDVKAPADKVWPLVSDFTRHGEWAGHGLQATKTSDGPVGVGTTYATTAKQFGTQKEHSTVTAMAPPSQFEWDSKGAL